MVIRALGGKRKTVGVNAGQIKRWWFVLHDSYKALKTSGTRSSVKHVGNWNFVSGL